MRKYIIGTVFGLVLGLSATAYADDIQSFIGQKIQGQTAVYLDGNKLDTAIIVDGKSYTPTRRIAESSGKKVSFKEGGIYLETPKVETPVASESDVPATPVTKRTLDQVNGEIRALTDEKKMFQEQFLDKYPDMEPDRIQMVKDKIVEIDAKLAALEAEKAELQK